MTNHDKAEGLNAEIILCNELEEIYKEELKSTEENITLNNQKRIQLQLQLQAILKTIENEQ